MVRKDSIFFLNTTAPVGAHFRSQGHSVCDLEIVPIEKIRQDNQTRKVQESYHIRKFNCVRDGLNIRNLCVSLLIAILFKKRSPDYSHLHCFINDIFLYFTINITFNPLMSYFIPVLTDLNILPAEICTTSSVRAWNQSWAGIYFFLLPLHFCYIWNN